MCDVLLPPGVNPTAVNIYIYIYIYIISIYLIALNNRHMEESSLLLMVSSKATQLPALTRRGVEV
jgi:hypothetical protein